MGGAKNCPETPRQKMIGMMYLVLTAMLALNVSTDILNGFILVDNSLHTSIDASDVRNKSLYEEFDYLYSQNPNKIKEWLDKATAVRQKSDSLYNYIQDFKYQIAKLADGSKADPEARHIKGNSNLDVTGQYGINEGHGAILKDKISQYRDYLIKLTANDSSKQAEFKKIFETPEGRNHDGDPISWEESIFDGMPVGASVTILTKIQNDIRTSEGEIIQYLKGQTDASDFRVNTLEALVVPDSKYVIRGGHYRAQIVLSAVDSTKKPEYFVNNVKLPETGVYEVGCSSTGSYKYSGILNLPKNDGTMLTLPFESDYSVGEPSVTISNTDLNVVYRGYDNNFSISVPGVSNDKVKVNVSGATSRSGGKGTWIIRPEGANKTVTISVSAEIDGKVQSMGSCEYRVKALPRPSAFLNAGENKSYSEGTIPRNALINPGSFLEASYGPDGLLNLNFEITGFMLMTDYGTIEAKGNKFTAAQLDQLKKLKKGSLVNIVNIRASGPNGKEIKLSAIPLKMQ